MLFFDVGLFFLEKQKFRYIVSSKLVFEFEDNLAKTKNKKSRISFSIIAISVPTYMITTCELITFSLMKLLLLRNAIHNY